MRLLPALFLLFVFATPAFADDITALPGGLYTLDKRHTSITFKISHLGFSYFTGRFDHIGGGLDYNPADPSKSKLDITIYPGSIDTNDGELDDTLRSENWFDTLKFPRATFRATKIEMIDGRHAKVSGDFTLRDVTHTLTLDVTLVGAGDMPLMETKVIGFSATGSFKRSDYGISNLLPMVGNDVDLQIESEFTKET